MQTFSATKQKIGEYWSNSASSYDSSFGHGLKTDIEKQLWLDLLTENIKLSPGSRILDVGSGTGFLSLLLAELGHRPTGIDLSEEMRTAARLKADKSGHSISFLEGDAEHPPFTENSFDAVISRHVVWTLPEPEKAFRNWQKSVRPGGYIIIIDGIWTPRSISGFLRFAFADTLRTIRGKCRYLSWSKDYVGKKKLPYYGGAMPSQLMSKLESAGVNNLWIDPMKKILAYERKTGPLDYRITFGKNGRYLIGGSV